MAGNRIKGQAVYASNFEVQKEAPIDARFVVYGNEEDLYSEETWKSDDGNVWLYDGLTVSLIKEIEEDVYESDFYILTDKNSYTSNLGWHKINNNSEIVKVFKSVITGDSQSLGFTGNELGNDSIYQNAFLYQLSYTNPNKFAVINDIEFKSTGSNTSELNFSYYKDIKTLIHIKAISSNDSVDSWNVTTSEDNLETTINSVIDSKSGQIGGFAPLNDSKQIPSDYLPSYVDDVIELYKVIQSVSELPSTSTRGDLYYVLDTKKIQTTQQDEGTSPETGKIYVVLNAGSIADYPANSCWRWAGSSVGLIRVGGQDTAQLETKISELENWKNNIDNHNIYTNGSIGGTTDKVTVEFEEYKLVDGSMVGDAILNIESATALKAGVMSATDKTNLDNVVKYTNQLTDVSIVGSTDGFDSSVNEDVDNSLYFKLPITKYTNESWSTVDESEFTKFKIPVATNSNSGIMLAEDKKKLSNINFLDLKTQQQGDQTYVWSYEDFRDTVKGKGLTILIDSQFGLGDNKLAGYCWSFGDKDLDILYLGVISHSNSSTSDWVNVIDDTTDSLKTYLKFEYDVDCLVKIIGNGANGFNKYDPSYPQTIKLITESI